MNSRVAIVVIEPCIRLAALDVVADLTPHVAILAKGDSRSDIHYEYGLYQTDPYFAVVHSLESP